MDDSKRYRTIVSYDGTTFYGFQYQRDLATVQGEIERAIYQVSGQQIRIAGAGRTDTGVHARGQVITFDLNWRHDVNELQRALNAIVDPAISFRDTAICDPRFHARYSATSRTYIYRLYCSAIRDPLRERYMWQVRTELNVDAMNMAAQKLLGEHDFAGFGQPTSGSSTIRRIDRVLCQAVAADEITFTIKGSGFLRGMVRRIVGALVQIGLGDWPVSRMDDLLLQKDINESAPPAPPQGLILWHVCYDDHGTADSR